MGVIDGAFGKQSGNGMTGNVNGDVRLPIRGSSNPPNGCGFGEVSGVFAEIRAYCGYCERRMYGLSDWKRERTRGVWTGYMWDMGLKGIGLTEGRLLRRCPAAFG
jgi:hypothetical protein